MNTCGAHRPGRLDGLAERAELITVGDRGGRLPGALGALAGRGLRRVSCEGGPGPCWRSWPPPGAPGELSRTISPLLLAGPGDPDHELPATRPAARLRLTDALEDEGFLFLRYLCEPPPPVQPRPAGTPAARTS